MRTHYIRKFNQTSPVRNSKRELLIDILRGTAVVLMLLAHFAYFLNDGSGIIKFFQNIGDTNAFVIFLFISGVVTFISYKRKKDKWDKSKKGILSRLIQLLIGYYIVAIISHLSHFSAESIFLDLINIFTFQLVPGFTEFILVFLVYSLIYLLIPQFYEKIGEKLSLSFLIGISLYVIGYLLYPIELPSILNNYKILLAGGEGYFRFPLLQYFIVFSLGLNLGNFLHIQKNPSIRQKRYFQFFFIFISLVFLTFLIRPYSIFTEFSDFERWPPTLPFMFVGLGLAFLLLFLFSLANTKLITNNFFKFIKNIGKDAYLYFIVHIILLQIYEIAWGAKISNFLFFIVLFPLFVLLCFAIVFLYKKLFVTDKKSKPDSSKKTQTKIKTNNQPTQNQQEQLNYEINNYNFNQSQNQQRSPYEFEPRKKNNNLLFLSILVLISAFGIGIFYFGFDIFGSPQNIYLKRDFFVQGEFINKRELAATSWWNYDYSYQRKISVYNSAVFSDVKKDNWVSININHANMVRDNKSLPDARDIRVVYLVENNLFTIVPTNISNTNNTNTKIDFKVINDIPSRKSDKNYFLYYGNFQANQNNTSDTGNFAQLELINPVLSAERKAQLTIDTNRTWVLKGLKEEVEQKLQVTMNINSAPFPETQSVDYRYRILNSDIEGKLFRDNQGDYYADIDVSGLRSDIYHIQAVAQSSDDQVLSPKKSFIVSEPLFVTWTMDWEGLNPSDSFLKAMDQMANKYEIPISHYFNPRIYVGLSNSRAQYLTDWVKERARTRGDSIDLHLHMFYDMARAAGVNPTQTEYTDSNGNVIRRETRPKWGSPNTEGYDVIMTSYTYEETKKVLDWALKQFERNGLPKPKGFRAGGWYLDLDNMRALESMNFSFDSSGRTNFIWGANRLTNPWNLRSTTQPYYPSKQNQNSSKPAPNFDVLEFPNNGADSYTFSGTDMINRFKANYSSGTFLEEKRIVTYLSHPHWFNIDEPKLNQLFSHINKYLYKNDNGPVVYIDMDDAYDYWAE